MYRSKEDELEDVSAQRQGHHFREEEAETNQSTNVAISVEPFRCIGTDPRGIEASLPRLVE